MSEDYTSPTEYQNTDPVPYIPNTAPAPDTNIIYNPHTPTDNQNMAADLDSIDNVPYIPNTNPDANDAPYNSPAATAPGAYPHPHPVPVPVGLAPPPSTVPNAINNNFGRAGAGAGAGAGYKAPMAPLSPNMNVMPVPIPMPVPTPTYAHHRENELNSNQMNQLRQQGFTEGMAAALSKSCSNFPLRIWIVDNSGSMNIDDGQRIIATASSTEVKSVPCTRWKEIQETVEYHIQMSGLLKAPTIFRFLNHPDGAFPQEFSVADKGDSSDAQIADDVSEALRIIRGTSPTGATPLSFHVREIHQMVQDMQPSLRAEGKRVAVILATDGLPSNNLGVSGESELKEFTDAVRLLEGLPIWIVVRLCTDNDEVVEFYNNLDNNLELSIEVLDNYTSEADEMYQVNSWLNYCLSLHRMRELGFQHRIFDLLDERSLTISELRDFFLLMFGVGKFDGVPEPELDFKGFMTSLDRIVKSEKEQWHPVKRRLKPLVSMTKLKAEYGRAGGGCTIM